MIDIAGADKVKAIINKKFPDKIVFKIGKYKDGYLAMAARTNNSFNDPYYFVKRNTVTQFLPMNDFSGFNRAFGPDKIYDNGKA